MTGLAARLGADSDVWAHGIGGAKDLPIPAELTIAGATAALVISFTVLAVAWRTPRYAADAPGRPAPAGLARIVDSQAFFVAARLVGLLAFAYTATIALLGQDLLTNPIFGIFYVLLWVGLIPLSLLLGPAWRAISPVRTINAAFARISGGDPDVGVFTYPERWGYWPAAFGLFAFVWMELVYPFSTELGPVRLWLALYVGAMIVGGALFGNIFYSRADPFEVFSTLVGHLSVWGRSDGRLVLRSPLANLATITAAPGLVGVGAVLFGSTAFDSFKDSSHWVRFIQSHESISGSFVGNALVNNAAMLAFTSLVGLLFAAGTMLTGVESDQPRRLLPRAFAHSIVPIIVGYFVAHYLTYFVEVGQATVIQLSDPFSTGANWFGTSNLQVNFWLSQHPSLLATTKVLAVVVGHVVGVVAAHDRAISLLPRKHQVTGQLSLLVVMVVFTAGGLYLLFSG